MAADAQRPQARSEREGQQERQRPVTGRGVAEGAAQPRQRGEDGHAEDGVGGVTVATGDLVRRIQAKASERKPSERATDEPHSIQVWECREGRGQAGECGELERG